MKMRCISIILILKQQLQGSTFFSLMRTYCFSKSARLVSRPSGLRNVRVSMNAPRPGLRGLFERLISSINEKEVLIFGSFLSRKKNGERLLNCTLEGESTL